MNKYLCSLAVLLGFVLGIQKDVVAQISLNYSLTGPINNYPSLVLGGNAVLTSGGIDANNNGWLRLTPNTTFTNGYAIIDKAFSSTLGVIVDFEYKSWGLGNDSPPGMLADGLTVFLYNGSVAASSFHMGDLGGGLGYAGNASGSVSGITGGYVGIGLDEYGNFSNTAWGTPGSGSSSVNVLQSVAVRGPSNTCAYLGGTGPNLTNTGTSNVASALVGQSVSYPVLGTSVRPTDTQYYRKARAILIPVLVNSIPIDFLVSLQLGITLNGSLYSVLNNLSVGSVPPGNLLKIGFVGSTGGASANHEVRNVIVTTPVDFAITKTVNKTQVKANDDILVYTLQISNVGSTGTGGNLITIADFLPAGLTLVSVPTFTINSGSPTDFRYNSSSNGAINMSINLPVKASGTITYKAAVNVIDSLVLSLTGTASIIPPTGFSDLTPENNSSVSQVFIKAVSDPFIIPNTFSPNGDGIEDVWEIQGIESYPNCVVQIFNRYGTLVYYSTGYVVPWNASYQGYSLPAGTYYYVIDLKDGKALIGGYVSVVK